MIGWNPLSGHVQSWNFSCDGGHALGVWSPKAGGWAAEIQGITGDGVATSAINTLARLYENTYVWQSVRRSAGNTPQPDTEEVILKRVTPGR